MKINRTSRLKDNPFFRHCPVERMTASGLKPDLQQKISVRGMCARPLDFIAEGLQTPRAFRLAGLYPRWNPACGQVFRPERLHPELPHLPQLQEGRF